ncbi:MAG: hypothetical protein WBV94_23865 [Blastocatellia bacterium]
MTNCPCDEVIFPRRLAIPAGLSRLPRQFATFPEFRAAMLSSIGNYPALRDWRARSSDDFGILLLEMWAYVCDNLSFYDEVIANEAYVRTTQQRSSLRRIVGLLGYVPRPAIASTAELAVFADGRQPIVLPAGTSFRSGAFPGSAPQVFELEAVAKAHPFLNDWKVIPNRSATIDGGRNLSKVSLTSVLLESASPSLKPGVPFLFDIVHGMGVAERFPLVVKKISNFPASDGVNYKRLEWEKPVSIPGDTLLSKIRITVPTKTAALWETPSIPGYSTARDIDASSRILALDRVHKELTQGSDLMIEKSGEVRWFIASVVYPLSVNLATPGATSITDDKGKVISVIVPPALKTETTMVFLDAKLNDPPRRSPSAPIWDYVVGGALVVHYAFVSGGTVAIEPSLLLKPGDSLALAPPFEEPQDKKSPNTFLLEDKNNLGDEIKGTINFLTGLFSPDQNSKLKAPLTMPVHMYGNIVRISQGETVPVEILGSGDASAANQSFKLKKKPLTYAASPTAGNEHGMASTLKVYVNGIEWKEVPSFFGQPPGAQVYIVRQNDAGESVITFGDGARGSRLLTGSDNVFATYRFGAGRISPPAGSIHQLGKPVKGIKSVRNPVAASGGDDAESSAGLSRYAPRSALLLGRAISIQDMEAAAAGVGGVRAVKAEWRWNKTRQRPVVQVWYIGAAGVAAKVAQTLRGLSDPATPIEVEQAMAIMSWLLISIQIDPRYLQADVLAAVRAALMDSETGLLSPERIGIGVPLFRSRIFDTVLSVPGATAVTGLYWNDRRFVPYGVSPGAGNYFDLESGSLILNGKAGTNG